MYSKDLVDKLIAKFPDAAAVATPDKFVRDPAPQVMVPAAKLHEICAFLKSDKDFMMDMPNQMTAVDYIKENQFELLYFLYSTKRKHAILVKARIPRDTATIQSVTDLWSGMDFQEREVFDLMGITFTGHPYLKRIMMWEGFPGHPLRKDYVHQTDKYDSGLEVGTPGLDEKGLPAGYKDAPAHA
jgi:NADH-quinone oxidoreductase subunit C